MKTVLVLFFIFCAAFAAPAEDKERAPEAPVVKEEKAAAPEMEDKMETKDEELSVPEDSVPVPRNAPVSEKAAAPQSRFQPCSDGWFSHGYRCFKFINTPMSWYNAEEHCRGLGANLASVTNPREYSFLQQITTTASQSIAWLGGFNLQNRWMWIDHEGFYYTNWYTQNSYSSYPCIYLRTTGGWSNGACSTSYRFICSKNPFGC